MKKGWEKWGLFGEGEAHGRISLVCINTWREGAKKMEPGSSWLCLVPGYKAIVINWKAGGSLLPRGNIYVLCWWLSPGSTLPRQTVGSLSLGMFKSQLDVVPGNWLWMALLGQGLYQMASTLHNFDSVQKAGEQIKRPLQFMPTCNFPLLWEGCSACNYWLQLLL